MEQYEEEKRDPNKFLEQIKNEEKFISRGKLKIFFGYSAGSGKTYSMLLAAIAEKNKGIDVVAGYIEPHDRPETLKWTTQLEVLPYKKIKYNNIDLIEFDLENALKRKPKLILVDEYAHSNAQGCKNKKRYQDIEELLLNGIDVYTTVNVQHIESLNDTVASITGIIVRERIPDSVFDKADQIEFIDLEPSELLERLNSGKIYKKTQAERAKYNFFSINNLTALREIALRRCADRVNLTNEEFSKSNHKNYAIKEHILVGLSSSPSNPKIIRTGCKMANAFHAEFSCVFVETPDFFNMSEENSLRLKEHINLAKSLGANIEILYGKDIAFQMAEYAKRKNVTKIIVGRSATKRRLFKKAPLTDLLVKYATFLELHIIPDENIIYK